MPSHKHTLFTFPAAVLTLVASLASCPIIAAQQLCTAGVRVQGDVVDPSNAVIPGAQVRSTSGAATTTDPAGHFTLPCAAVGTATLVVAAQGFTPATLSVAKQPGGIDHLHVQLAIIAATANVVVSADAPSLDTSSGAGTTTLSADAVRQLPDDPDDLLQQLQLLASVGGGAAASATVVVDGFQNGSALPPKSAIASIRIDPDPVAPEYARPGEDGGRVEIITKPGSDAYHGALFFADSDATFNATDPFSSTATPASKQRYGFELSGPIVRQKAGFTLGLERRDINEFNVVNAVTLDAEQNEVSQHDSVPAPQTLWIGSARADWQVSGKDTAALSYAAQVNNLGNQGIGGLTLAAAGYSSRAAEYDLRLSNTYTLSANTLHETHIGYTWKRTQQQPNSTAPAVQVAGYFTGGGATSQNLDDRERDLEVDDDVMGTHGRHTVQTGVQSLGFFVHDYDPDTFNGAYVFGGGSAPVLDPANNPTGLTANIAPIEQYRRATLNLPGGTPTTYQLTTGNPVVPYTAWQVAFYGQDTIKLLPRLVLTTGVRYAFQTSPSSFDNVAPRIAAAWSPDKQSRWTLHLRAGLFQVPLDLSDNAEAYRLDGVRQQESTVYSPSFIHPLTPVPGSVPVATQWQFARGSEQIPVGMLAGGLERDLPHHWHPSLEYTRYFAWGDPRAVNINAPVVSSSVGAPPDATAALLAPRPGAPGLNIFQYQNSAHNRGGIFWVGMERKGDTRWTFSTGFWSVNLRNNGDTPQSTYSNRGEAGRPDWQTSGALIENDLKLPFRFELSAQAYWHYGTPYDITTGTDANGDGSFNDRPSYASTPGDGVYATPYGLMTANVVNGDVPRNLGTMPTVLHTYANFSRSFALNANKDHARTLTLNARSANWVNHTNVTAVDTVLASGALGQPVAAEAARRLELGARFAF